jgi:hypothetical protein
MEGEASFPKPAFTRDNQTSVKQIQIKILVIKILIPIPEQFISFRMTSKSQAWSLTYSSQSSFNFSSLRCKQLVNFWSLPVQPCLKKIDRYSDRIVNIWFTGVNIEKIFVDLQCMMWFYKLKLFPVRSKKTRLKSSEIKLVSILHIK